MNNKTLVYKIISDLMDRLDAELDVPLLRLTDLYREALEEKYAHEYGSMDSSSVWYAMQQFMAFQQDLYQLTQTLDRIKRALRGMSNHLGDIEK